MERKKLLELKGGREYQSVNGLFAVKVLVDVWGPKLFADVTVIQTDSREAANSLVARKQLIRGRENLEYLKVRQST